MRGLACWAILAGLGLTAGCSQEPRNLATFGGPVQTAKAVRLSKAVAQADKAPETALCTKAEIHEVCAKRGCWMVLEDGDEQVRVRFTASADCSQGFFVPRNAAGHTAYVQGRIVKREMPQEEARHYAHDAGKSDDEIAKIVGPQPTYEIVATGVAIAGADTLDAPVQ